MRRIWVTRDEPQDGPLAAALRDVGLIPIHEPVIERITRSDANDELARLGPDDWLILTSAFAVECLAHEAITAARQPRVIAVGDATADAARRGGLRVEETAQLGGAEKLFQRLRRHITRGTVCYPRSSLATPPEPWADVTIRSPVVYETMARNFDRSVIDRVDMAAVASPSAVRAIGRVDLLLASIGPTTTAAIRELGMQPTAEAHAPTFDALARTIADTCRNGPRTAG